MIIEHGYICVGVGGEKEAGYQPWPNTSNVMLKQNDIKDSRRNGWKGVSEVFGMD